MLFRSEERLDAGQHLLAFTCQNDEARASFKQPDPQPLFESGDLHGYRRLGYPKRFRGGGHATMANGGGKRLKFVEINRSIFLNHAFYSA